MGGRPAGGGAGPGRDLRDDTGIGHVADNGLAGDSETGLDVAELAVPVRGLVEVHEVHVDGGPGQFDVCLGVQVQQGLSQQVEAGDPHFGRAERVHPGDDTDHSVISVGVKGHPANRLRILQHRLPLNRDRNLGCHAERIGNGPRLLGDLRKGLFAIEPLASGEKPDRVRLQVGNDAAAHASAPAVVGFAAWPYTF